MPSPSPPADRRRSPSPRRSRSPPASKPKSKKSGGGFNWKDKSRPAGDNRDNDNSLKRGYRDRSPRRDSYRSRDDRDDRENRPRRDDRRRDDRRDRSRSRERRDYRQDDRRDDRRDDNYRPRERREERRESDHDRPPAKAEDQKAAAPEEPQDNTADPLNIASKFGGAVLPRGPSASTSNTTKKPSTTTELSRKAAPKPAISNEPMMLVTVNDRLGTKAQIPCLASDSVKVFKAMVAAKIGRQTHEIMIKRQGERPFKDMLTLADYSVSHGVQLDLELDTGD